MRPVCCVLCAVCGKGGLSFSLGVEKRGDSNRWRCDQNWRLDSGEEYLERGGRVN